MKCPLIMMSLSHFTEQHMREAGGCLAKECGLWDANSNHCAVLEISRLLQAAGVTLGTIAKELTLLHPGRGG